MRSSRGTWYFGRVGQAVLTSLLVTGLTAQISEKRPRIGVPEDWSHHRIRFSSALLRQHPELAAREPRAVMQLYRDSIDQARAFLQRSLAAPSASAGITQPHRDWSVSLGSGRIQFDQYPAKWQADPTALPSCTTDYVVMALNVPGVTGGQPSIVGLNNLFAGGANPLCLGNQPNFLFSYNTTTLPSAAQGKILTSPILSIDGKKVAFIETSTVAGQHASVLHVLNIPTSGSQVTATPASAPPAGAMSSTTISAGFANTRSSPWLDYGSDTLYVGLDDGKVYKVTGVFKGTPTVAGAPWPVLTRASAVLSSPVIDTVNGKLFIGSGAGVLYTFNINSPPVSPATATGIQVGKTGPVSQNQGIFDAPILDATGGSVFAITSNAATLTGAAVVQVSETSPFPIQQSVFIGLGSSAGATVNIYDGDFDNNYFNNPNLTLGHMLVCGTGSADTTPYRYLLGFNASGVIQPGPSTQLSTNAAARCGPVTEYFNPNIGAGGTDFFFWSVTRNCPAFGGNGCVMALANGTTLTSAQEIGGASGILIDNDYVTKTGGSSIYFSSEGVPLNAVKLTQQGLQ
jgi:hypothetical protein